MGNVWDLMSSDDCCEDGACAHKSLETGGTAHRTRWGAPGWVRRQREMDCWARALIVVSEKKWTRQHLWFRIGQFE